MATRVSPFRVGTILLAIQAELAPQVGEAGRIHGTAVQEELTQRRQPGRSEHGTRSPLRPDLDQAALQYASHCGWQLRLARLRSRTPSAQQEAVRRARVLAEVLAQLAADQVPLLSAR
jgi:hypothetical protein